MSEQSHIESSRTDSRRVEVYRVEGILEEEVRRYLDTVASATFVDDPRWKQVIYESYGYKTYWLLAKRGVEACGALGLTFARHPIFGEYLGTAPYGNYGGFYYDDYDVASRLLDEARLLQSSLGARYTCVREISSDYIANASWRPSNAYSSYFLDVPMVSDEQLISTLSSKVRWTVKKSLSKGGVMAFGRNDLKGEFWYVINRAMRDLGSPYHSQKYLNTLLRHFGEDMSLVSAKDCQGNLAGAALLIWIQDTAVLLHANILKEFRGSGMGETLYYNILRECNRRGIRVLDLGRSLKGSGNEEFKLKWRPRVIDLTYWYSMKHDDDVLPRVNQGNPRYRMLIAAWKRTPLSIHRLIGPHIVRGVL